MPTYLGVYNSLYNDIMEGVYPPNGHLPGETALAEEYGVSRNTLRQALAILSEDGMIIRSQGKGTLVAPNVKKATSDPIENPMLTLCKQSVSDASISYNYGAPTDIARNKLMLVPSELVLACNCVFQSGETILGYSFTQIPAKFFNELTLDTSQEDSIKEIVIEKLFRHSEKLDITIKLIYANEIEIEFLKIPLDTPLILIEALHLNEDDHPFARNKFYFIPEYYHLNFIMNR